MKRFIKKPMVIISFVFFALLVSALQFTPPEIIYKIFIRPADASNITDLYGITGHVGKEDIKWGTGLATDTFPVPTYSGGTITLTKLPSLYANAASIIKGKWHVAAIAGDHGDAALTGSLAWVINTLGTDPATIDLPGNQTYSLTTNLAIPETIVLDFQRGAILGGTGNISGDGLKHIQAGAWQIFSTTGTITFPDGSDLKSSWFADFETAIAKISTAKVGMEVTEADTIASDTTVNANTALKWTGPGKVLTIALGKTLAIEDGVTAGAYQIFSGAGTVALSNTGALSRSKFTYNGGVTPYTIKAGAAVYYCKDKLAFWDSELTTTAIGSPVASTWYYLYLDYSEITSGTEIVAGKLIWSTTAPSWNGTYKQWMNGDDRCVFAMITNGTPNNLPDFSHDGGDLVSMVMSTDYFETAPGDSASKDTVTLTIPTFSTKAIISVFTEYVSASDDTRMEPYDSDVWIRVGTVEIASKEDVAVAPIMTDSSQRILVWTASGNAKVTILTCGYYFPSGM